MDITTNNGPFDDASLVSTLEGFQNHEADLGGLSLHYVTGGSGEPLILLPGWPQTWWQFSRVLVPLAERYQVFAVDLRGMGGSSAPTSGYDKKTMAGDIRRLVNHLGLGPVHIAGNDIGSMVAYSFAANHPDATRKLVMMDAPHPFEVFAQIPVVPPPGAYDMGPGHGVHPWWFAFNQLTDLANLIFADHRYAVLQDWIFDYLSVERTRITAHDREVYAAAYNQLHSMRAVAGWFSSFPKDISDAADYAPLEMPVLGLGGISHDLLALFLSGAAPDALVERMDGVGHFVPDEAPELVATKLIGFLG